MRRKIRPFRERKRRPFRLMTLGLLTVFLMGMFSQVVFATTYVITDGPRVFTYTAFTGDPAQVLGDAGLGLREADSYTARDVDGAAAIIICRAQTITVRYHGQEQEVSSRGEKVGALLARLGLTVEADDTVSPGVDADTFDGMTVSVDRIFTQRQTYTTRLPGGTRECCSAQLPSGVREVLVPGADGELLRTADVTYINGVEARREILQEDMLSAPVTELVAVGIGPELPRTDPKAVPVIGENTITLPTGEVLTYTHTDLIRATAYTHTDEGRNMTTSTGSKVRVGTVAVDPRYIPYGTRMFIMAEDGSYVYGVAEAEDCGGDIKGDRMDLYMPTFEDCMEFGRRRCIIYFLG